MAGSRGLARWAVALTLGISACGAESGLPTATGDTDGEQESTAPLLALIASAPTRVAFLGVRRFEAHWDIGGVPQELAYREEVAADGEGQLMLTPVDVLAPTMSPGDEELFLVTQKLRERTMYFARDFGIRDLSLFAANYTLVDTGLSTVVAGVQCQRTIVTGTTAPQRRYLLDVNTTTGLVLSAREELLDGTLVSLMQFESIDTTPDLSGVAWSNPVSGEQDLVPGSQQAFQSLGFVPRLPKVLPAGWQQIGFSKVVDPTNDEVWAKVVYSDGVEQIFYMVAETKQPKHVLVNPPPGAVPNHADRVSKMAVGPWTLLDADLAQGKALLLGRTADGVLEGLLQSALF